MRALTAALGQAVVYDWRRHVQDQAAAARGSIASMIKRARQVDGEDAAAANDQQQASALASRRFIRHSFNDVYLLHTTIPVLVPLVEGIMVSDRISLSNAFAWNSEASPFLLRTAALVEGQDPHDFIRSDSLS